MESNLYEIIQKLETFIRKYLLYKILRGFYFTVGLIIVLLLLLSTSEYFNYFPVITKKVLIILATVFFLVLLIINIILPLLSLLKIRKPLSYNEAASIVSRHFPQVQDKLLNTLELGYLIENGTYEQSLIIASIHQRTVELRPFSFDYAISFKTIKKYFVFFAASIFLLVCVMAFSPGIINNGAFRLINYSTYFEPNSPFQFHILNQSLVCERGKDFIVDLKITGEYLPDKVYIRIGNNFFLMSKGSDLNKFSFVIKNVNNDLDFQLKANEFNSKYFRISVLPAPLLKSFFVTIVPPSYTGLETLRINNAGDITVPFGSVVTWNLSTINVNLVDFSCGLDSMKLKSTNANFVYKHLIKEASQYSMSFANEHFRSGDNLKYNIAVIPDLFPEIEYKTVEDSLKIGAFYYLINLKDDYGFHDLTFVTKILGDDSLSKPSIAKLQAVPQMKNQEVFYYFDFNSITNLPENSSIEYYFEVRDNDYISGFKSSKTGVKIFKPLNRDLIRDNLNESEKKSEEALSKSKKITNDIQKEIEDFKRKELSNDLNEWEKQNYLKNILEKQKGLDKFIENIKDEYQKKSALDNQFYKNRVETLEKQKQVNELLNQILDDELKKLLEDINKLSQNYNEKDFEKIKEKIDFSYKNLEKKLDRTLEILKRYQVEDKVSHLSEDLEKLSEKQKNLSNEKTTKKEKDQTFEEQKNLNNEFDDLKEEFKETLEKNDELKSPYKLEDYSKSFDKIDNKMEELNKEMPSNSNKKNNEKQNDISKDMKDLAKSMGEMFDEMSMEAMEMNMGDLRQLIENLSSFSFDQEDVYTLLNKTLSTNPAYPEIITRQNKIKNDYQLIDDSLNALSSRISIMSQLITKESDNIKFNLDKANGNIEDRNRREALNMQRLIMNSSNVLDLLLDELMQQMQNQKGSSSGKGKKKNGETEQMESLKKQQQKLKEQLQKLIDEMRENANKPNGSELNEEIVKSLAEQEIFNKMLQDIQNGKNINPETGQKLKEIKQLSDKNINDLINKNITPELFNRNQKILSRLLEAENAEKEREQEKKRESKEGIKNEMLIPESLKEMMKKDQKYHESLKKGNINLKKYYQNINDEYFRKINN